MDRLSLALWRMHRGLNALKSPEGRRGLRYRVAPSTSAQAMLQALRPSFIVDVGANRGQFTLDALIALPASQVLAIEPNEDEADRLAQVIGGRPGITVERCAAGAASGTAILKIPTAADSASLLAPSEAVHIFPGLRTTREVVVEVRTLDEILESRSIPPDSLLKIDVQGYELEVLRGAGDRIADFRWIYVEVSLIELYSGQPLLDEVVRFAHAAGFRIADLADPVRRGGMTVQVDLLFVRPEPEPAGP